MSLPYSKIAAAQVALREAARALNIGDGHQVGRVGLDDLAARALAADVAHTLEAMAALLRRAGNEPVPTSAPTSGAGCQLDTLFHDVCDSAALARNIAGDTDHVPEAFVASHGRPTPGPDD